MKSLNKKEVLLITVMLMVLIGGSFVNLGKRNKKKVIPASLDFSSEVSSDEKLSGDGKEKKTGLNEDESKNIQGGEGESPVILVHIAGQVNSPGLLKLKEGDRVYDAIELAGGLKNEADLGRINLARKLADEEKIYIPKLGEELEETTNDYVKVSDDGGINSKIDINTASKEELMTLPGIGDKTADKIINYRLENKFKKVEDIKNVSGIGDKKFEQIEALIIVK